MRTDLLWLLEFKLGDFQHASQNLYQESLKEKFVPRKLVRYWMRCVIIHGL